MTNSGTVDVAQEIDKVTSVIATARRLLSEGKLVDLSALEEKVRSVCQAIEAQPQKHPEKLQEAMLAAITDLDRLAEDIRQRFAGILQEPEEAPPARVAAAYRKPGDES